MAGGETYIGGVGKSITGGKTMIGGVAKTITGGKTMIGDVVKNIVFAKTYTLRDVFADMTLIPTTSSGYYNYSSNTSSKRSVVCDKPDASRYYVIGACNGQLAILEVYNGQMSLIVQSDTTITIGIGTSYYSVSYNSSSSNYGASIACVTLPNIPRWVAFNLLYYADVTKIAGRNSTSTGYVRTTNTSHDFYLMTRYGNTGTAYQSYGYDSLGMSIWEPSGSSWSRVNTIGQYDGCAVSSGYLTCGAGTYGASCVAIDEVII